jgi:hypothetical protein
MVYVEIGPATHTLSFSISSFLNTSRKMSSPDPIFSPTPWRLIGEAAALQKCATAADAARPQQMTRRGMGDAGQEDEPQRRSSAGRCLQRTDANGLSGHGAAVLMSRSAPFIIHCCADPSSVADARSSLIHHSTFGVRPTEAVQARGSAAK